MHTHRNALATREPSAHRWRLLGTLALLCRSVAPAVAPLPLLSPAAPPPTVSPASIRNVAALSWPAGQGAVYVANASGLYRSMAAPYLSWTRQNNREDMGALSANPRNPNDLLYTAGGTLYHSVDGGRSGRAVPTPSRAFGGLVRAPSQPSFLYAVYEVNTVPVVGRSVDDGLTWSAVYTPPGGGPGPYIHDLVLDPRTPARALVATEDYHEGHITETRDGGATWHDLGVLPDSGIPATGAIPTLVALSPSHPRRIWVVVQAMGDTRLVRSDDGGRTWSVAAGLPRDATITMVQEDPRGRVYAVSGDTSHPAVLYRSTDGVRFEAVTEPGSVASWAVLSADGRYMVGGDPTAPLTVLRLSAGGAIQRLTPYGLPAPMALHGRVLFVVGADNNLYALSPREGRVLWYYHAGGLVSLPLLADGLAYVGSADGRLAALRPGTGRVVWSTAVGGAITQLMLRAGVVYLATLSEHVVAVDAHTGRVLWRENIPTGGAYFGPPLIAEATSGVVLAQAGDTTMLYALRATDGHALWRTRLTAELGSTRLWGLYADRPQDLVYAGPEQPHSAATTLPDGRYPWPRVAVFGGQVYTVADRRAVVALDIRTGRRVWTGSGHDLTLLAEANALLYVEEGGTMISALNTRTGQLRWQFRTRSGTANGFTTVVGQAVGGVLPVATFAGSLYGLDERTGRQIWTFQVAELNRPPVQAGELLYVASGSTGTMALDVRTGRVRERWSPSTGVIRAADPADGYIYSGDRRGLEARRPSDNRRAWRFPQEMWGDPLLATLP